MRALAEFFPGVVLLFGVLLVSAPASAPSEGESEFALSSVALGTNDADRASQTTADRGGSNNASLDVSAEPSLMEFEPGALPEPTTEDATELLPTRTVGMCGDHAQSIEAPPPIYPGSASAMRACAPGGEQVDKLDSLPPAERLALDSAPSYRTAILAEPLRVFPAPGSTIDFPESARCVTDEHRAREPRPPRG